MLFWAKEVEGSDKLRTIHDLDSAQSLAIIEKLYELGAVKVTAIEIESDPIVGETTNMLTVGFQMIPNCGVAYLLDFCKVR